MSKDAHPDDPKNVACTLRNVTQERLHRGVRFVVFLIQGKLFQLIADGKAADPTKITDVPQSSSKLVSGWMKIKHDKTFEVRTLPFVGAPSIPLPDMRAPLINALKEIDIDVH